MGIVRVGLVVLLLALAAGGLVVALPGGGQQAGPARPRQGIRGWLRLAGLLLGLLGAVLVSRVDVLGRGLLVAAPVAAFGLLLGVLAAELAVRPPAGPRRTASLVTRRAGDYLPRRMTGAVVATGVTLLVLGVVTTALGSTDDMGRAGRRLELLCPPSAQGPFGQGRGPWPGSFYTEPLVVVVLVGVLLALLVLRTTVARPPVPVAVAQGAAAAAQAEQAGQAGQAGQAAALDAALRARSAQAVVAAVGVLLSVPLAGMSLFAGSAVGGMGGCAPAWWTGVGLALGVLALAATGVLLWCAPIALLGGRAPRLDDDPSRRG